MQTLIQLIFLLLSPRRFVEGFLPQSSPTQRAPHKPSAATVFHHHTLLSRPTELRLSSPDNNDDEILPDPGFLVCDLFAIVIASELMGLLDSVNDPTWQGWFSPISGVPETINVLIARFSMLGFIWIGSNVVASRVFVDDNQQKELLPAVLKAGAAFSVFRVILEVLLNRADPNLGVVLRDCYLVTLSTTAFRYLYGQLFW